MDRSRRLHLIATIGLFLASLTAVALTGCCHTAAPKHVVKRTDPANAFTDYVPYPSRRVAFEMVLIPGNTTQGIKPFYVGKTEVTWDMFRRWSYGDDLVTAD